MKTYRYPLGNHAGETMTVLELRKVLEYYSDDMPVFGRWEGVDGYIRPGYFDVEVVSKGFDGDACEALLICVDLY